MDSLTCAITKVPHKCFIKVTSESNELDRRLVTPWLTYVTVIVTCP
jgi:hypothetical protein